MEPFEAQKIQIYAADVSQQLDFSRVKSMNQAWEGEGTSALSSAPDTASYFSPSRLLRRQAGTK